jgi:hypothetical protein
LNRYGQTGHDCRALPGRGNLLLLFRCRLLADWGEWFADGVLLVWYGSVLVHSTPVLPTDEAMGA